ncbi:MAG: hypothetical protein ABI461_22985 [Polyangiaceae bacterium]
MQYAWSALGIVACPFCREMFDEAEAEKCPVCGMKLAPLSQLPPSHESLAEEDPLANSPAEEPLPASFMGRGKGVLGLLGFAGLLLFFLPWIHVYVPDRFDMSGFDLARKIGWSWGAAVAWAVLVPTVLSRRSIVKMRGARVAAATLSVVPAFTVAIFLLKPPHNSLVPIRIDYGPAIWATLVISVIATIVSFTLGGRIDDIPVPRKKLGGRHTAAGETLH